MSSNRLAVWVGTLVPLAALASAAQPRISAEKIVEALIRDLGAERYEARERATELLRRVGQPAQDALEKAAESDDPEVRLRAREVLADVRLGIGPEWPADIILLVRHYDNLQEHERSNAIYRIGALGPKGVPFLIRRMEIGSRNEAAWALNALQQRPITPETALEITRLIGEPKNEHLARALAWARAQRGQALEGIETLAASQPVEAKRDKAVEDAIQAAVDKLVAGKATDALAVAEALAKQHPAELRALYLQAEALAALNRDKDATALREKALALSPEAELPHYLAAELLTKLGRYRLAVKEWQRVTEIEPSGGPCDINALVNLAAIYTTNGLFETAAQHLQSAIQALAKAKDQEKVKPLASALQMEQDRLRQRAASFPAPADAPIDDAIPPNELEPKLRVIPAQGKPEDLQQAIAATAAQFQIAVALPAIPVLDLSCTTVKYEKDAKRLLILFHDNPACDPLPLEAEGNDTRVALHLPGCTHIYSVNAASGAAERLARFEKSYILTLKPGLKVSNLANPAVRINGRPYEWDKLLAGVPLSHLPERFEVIVEGSTPLGRRITARASFEATEPAPELPPAPTAPPDKPKG